MVPLALRVGLDVLEEVHALDEEQRHLLGSFLYVGTVDLPSYPPTPIPSATAPSRSRRIRRPRITTARAMAAQVSGGEVRLVGARVAPDDAGNAPQVGQPPLRGGSTVT